MKIRVGITLLITVFIAVSCNKKDRVVAEVFHQKLYLSEIQQQLPDNLSEEDSILLCQKLIDQWVTKQVVLNAAKQELSISEQAFAKELQDFKDNLLMNAYFDKITSDTSLFQVTDTEVRQYMHQYSYHYAVEREIIKLNYIRLSKHSKIEKSIRDIFFNDNKRISLRPQLIKMCADSIEYFMDDETWLYLDEISKELPETFITQLSLNSNVQHIVVSDDTYDYLIVKFDYHTKHVKGDLQDELESAKAMLIQKKKSDYIKQRIQELKNEIE